MPHFPKSQIIISIIIAIDILLVFNIYEKREIIFGSTTKAEAARITVKSESKVAGARTVRSFRANSYILGTKKPPSVASNTPTPQKTSTPSPTKTPTPTQKILTPTPTNNSSVQIVNSPTPTKTPQQATSNSPIMSQINSYRSSQGKAALSEEGTTCSFANLRAGEIVNSFSHDGFRNRIDSKTLPYPSYSHVSENIAMNSNPNDVVPGWINSSGHRENLLAEDPYGCVGISGNYYTFETWKP